MNEIDLTIKDKIYNIRGKQVMLDSDLADLYGVATKILNKAVKRNLERFPEDFMFRLTEKEFKNIQNSTSLRYRFGTLETKKGKHRKYLPFVFTEQGVSMLSAVLKSKKAIEVSINIINAFVAMRKFLSENKELVQDMHFIKSKVFDHDKNFEKIFKALEDKGLPEKGIFFDGQVFDAFVLVSKLIKKAEKEIILIDNYVDENTLKLFSDKKENVNVTIYTNNILEKLILAVDKFNEQYGNLEVTKFNKSHDRFLIIDEELYHIGASLKDLGKKWFGFSKINFKLKMILKELID